MNRRRCTLLICLILAAVSWISFQLGQSSNRTDATTPEPARIEKPLIGIASLTDSTYIRALRDAGAVPVVLPNTDGAIGNETQIAEYLDVLDGLLMPGGRDIPPSEYGEEPHPTVSVLSDDRYQFEKALISAWIKQTDKPLLGVCLGGQWINVAHGGSLVQDIPSEFGVVHRDTNHMVTLAEDSKLSQIYGESTFKVNSNHHQAVKKLGRGLRIVAKCPDGIVEAIETTDSARFLIGVQWHPERMVPDDKQQAKLFRAFVEAAKEGRRP